jgi:cytochrome c553
MLMKRFSLLAAAVVVGWSAHAQGRDPVAGKAAAGMCATCHGPMGISQLPNAPHLAGQPAIYIVEQLKSYRSGKRQNEVMGVIAKPLTDDEIENLAAWYASIQISVTPK